MGYLLTTNKRHKSKSIWRSPEYFPRKDNGANKSANRLNKVRMYRCSNRTLPVATSFVKKTKKIPNGTYRCRRVYSAATGGKSVIAILDRIIWFTVGSRKKRSRVNVSPIAPSNMLTRNIIFSCLAWGGRVPSFVAGLVESPAGNASLTRSRAAMSVWPPLIFSRDELTRLKLI
jgi:hypothetical protein